MVENVSGGREGEYERVLEQLHRGNTHSKLHSEADFWTDMAKGVMPAAVKSVCSNPIETGSFLVGGAIAGVGLAWMENPLRPIPTRIAGGLINLALGAQFIQHTWNTGSELRKLKERATTFGDYDRSAFEAQNLSGKFLAEFVLGAAGTKVGYHFEPSLNRGITRFSDWWNNNRSVSQPIPIGLEGGVHPVVGSHDVSQSPYYMAMSKARKNKNKQNKAKQVFEPRPEPRSEPSPEPKQEVKSQSSEPKSENENDLFKLLDEQAIRKGKVSSPETFEDLPAVKKARDLEAFRSSKTDKGYQIEDKWFEILPADKQAKFTSELEVLRKTGIRKDNEEIAEQWLQGMDKAATPSYAEARADHILNANERFADEILAASEKSPLIQDLFLEARSGKYPDDASVVFVDEKGRLIRYTNDYVSTPRAFNYRVEDLKNGTADYKLISEGIVKGAVIFGSSATAHRPLLGTVGEVPAKLTDCGNYREFVLATRLDKKLSQFDFVTGFKTEISKKAEAIVEPVSGAPEPGQCEDGVCAISSQFLSKLKADKDGVLSQKPDGMSVETGNTINKVEPITFHDLPVGKKLDSMPHLPGPTMLNGFDNMTLPKTTVEPVNATVVDPVIQPVIEPAAKPLTKREAALKRLDKEEDVLRSRLDHLEQVESSRTDVSRSVKNEIKSIEKRLLRIQNEKRGLGVVVEETVSSSKNSSASVPAEPAKAKDQIEIEEEAKLLGLPEGVYGRYSEFEPGFKERFDQARNNWFKRRDELVREAIEREAQEQGLPEGVFGRYSEFTPGFKQRFSEARDNYLARVAEEARAKEAEASAQKSTKAETESEVKIEPEVKIQTEERPRRERKTDAQIEVDLLLKNKFLADAFKASGRGRDADQIVLFVKDAKGLISAASFPQRNGKPGSLSTKDDFYHGRVPVELLKNEVIGWARVAPKVEDGGYVYRTNPRRPEMKFTVKEVLEAHGQVPPEYRSVVTDNIPKPYNDRSIPSKVFSPEKPTTPETTADSLLAELHRRRDSIQKELDNHYQSMKEGVDEGRLMSSQVDEYKAQLNKLEELIAGEAKTSETARGETETQQAGVDQFALNPAEPRVVKIDAAEKLTTEITSQLDSWKSKPRAKTNLDNIETTLASKQEALKHVSYNVHARSKELFAQGKYAEAEAWATTLLNLVKQDKEVFDVEYQARALSWLGEVFRVQGKMNESESCLKSADLMLKNASFENKSVLEASVLESYAKLLRSEFAQSRLQEAREFEARRRRVIDECVKYGKDLQAGVGLWNKIANSMRDRRTAQISMEYNASGLDRSLKILNWFDIKL